MAASLPTPDRAKDVIVGMCFRMKLDGVPMLEALGASGYPLATRGRTTLAGCPRKVPEIIETYTPADFGRPPREVLGLTWFFVDRAGRPCSGFNGEEPGPYVASLDRFCHVYGRLFEGMKAPFALDSAA